MPLNRGMPSSDSESDHETLRNDGAGIGGQVDSLVLPSALTPRTGMSATAKVKLGEPGQKYRFFNSLNKKTIEKKWTIGTEVRYEFFFRTQW